MLSLERKGLLRGDYFVVGVDLEQYAASEPEKYLRGILNNDTEEAAVRAYQSYLAIIPSAPIEFDEFAGKVSPFTVVTIKNKPKIGVKLLESQSFVDNTLCRGGI